MIHFPRFALRLLHLTLAPSLALLATSLQAHPAPFSYVDIDLGPERIAGSVRVHTIDIAHELSVQDPSVLLHQHGDARQEQEIKGLLDERLQLSGERRLLLRWGEVRVIPEDDALEVGFTSIGKPPASLRVEARLFPYDPQHQTFVNVSEQGQLRQQWILDGGSTSRVHFAGTAAGLLATLQTFVPSGVEHILIGPDHILFVIGLLLLGGSLRRLALIVTSFTIGHSITLSLAALDILAIPAAVIEPLIALSIVVVGVDNLIRKEGKDLRPWFAGVFGLIHGFGFASVLREFGLPQGNLATALFGFNLGVEVGQLAIVLVVSALLVVLRKRVPGLMRPIATIGSLAVIAAGAYWFVTRTFLAGGGA